MLPEQIAELLKALSTTTLRFEKGTSESALEQFVPLVDLDALLSPNSHIVFGRNGTGKTHLFTAAAKHAEAHFETLRVLPVYVDFRELDLGPNSKSLALEVLVQRFYGRFVTRVVAGLTTFVDSTVTATALERWFGKKGSDRVERINRSITGLSQQLNQERIQERLKNYERRVSNEDASEDRSNASLSMSLKGSRLDVRSGVGGATEGSSKANQIVEAVYEGLAVLDYESIRTELENIIDSAGAKAIVVLVDEWSSVDLSVQPLLAEMIRKTVGASDKIFLKIAALKYLTRTSAAVDPPLRIGLEPGIAITPLADLDARLTYDLDAQRVKDFLTLVAYKHAATALAWFADYTPAEFEAFLCESVFSRPEAYFEVVRASEGNPRDFLSMLLEACSRVSASNATLEIRDSVRIAASYFSNTKAPALKSNPEAADLFGSIFKEVVKKKQKLCLFSTSSAERDVRLQELWHYRFLHVVHSPLPIPDEDGVPTDYTVYSIDYGKMVSMKVHAQGEAIVDKVMNSMGKAVSSFLGLGFIADVATRSLQANSELRKQLIRLTGTYAVTAEEEADLDLSRQGVEEFVLDRLLYQ